MTKYRSGNNKYDAIGNPTQFYNGRTYKMTWKGRQLQTLTLSGVTTTFTYNADGLRINKTTGGVSHDYVWSGDMLLAEVTTDYTLRFLYNGSGEIVGFEHITASTTDTDITYYYEKNIFGDVIGIYNENGTKVATYAYNAYGQCHVLTNHTDAAIGSLNPIRYRSYYYDADIYLYYLQTRYYDPVACRFVNPDAYVSTGQGFIGHNMFAYCGNNPVNRVDFSGRLWVSVALAAVCVIGFVGLLTSCSSQSSEDDSEYEYEYQGQSFSQGYDTIDEAAIAGAMLIEAEYQKQIKEKGYLGKYEYSTIIYQFPGDPKFYVSERYVHTDGNGGSVKPQSEKPDYATIVGRIHSHPWQNDIKFSEQDTINANSNSNVEYYLAEFDRYSNELLTVYHFKRGERPATRKELIWPINNV